MIPNDSPTNILMNRILDGYQELLQKSLIMSAMLDRFQKDWPQRLEIEMKAGAAKEEAVARFAAMRKMAHVVLLGQMDDLFDLSTDLKPPTIQ